MNSKETSDLLLLSMGAYTPLNGFMNELDWKLCILDMKLSSGLFWPIPITLSVTEDEARELSIGEEVSLVELATDRYMATMEVSDIYCSNKRLEAENIFATTDTSHPGVAKLLNEK